MEMQPNDRPDFTPSQCSGEAIRVVSSSKVLPVLGALLTIVAPGALSAATALGAPSQADLKSAYCLPILTLNKTTLQALEYDDASLEQGKAGRYPDRRIRHQALGALPRREIKSRRPHRAHERIGPRCGRGRGVFVAMLAQC